MLSFIQSFFIVHFVCFFVASAFPSSLNFERGLAVLVFLTFIAPLLNKCDFQNLVVLLDFLLLFFMLFSLLF